MPHYNGYDSFQTKKGKEKKRRAREKSFKIRDNERKIDFVIDNALLYGVVIEVKYNYAYVFYRDQIVSAEIRKDLNMVCNQVIFPGDKVVLEKNGEKYIIMNLLRRSSILSRVKKDGTRLDSAYGTRKYIAANIDLAVIVVAAKEPPLHPKFIDRYYLILKNSGIDVIICLNKSDLKTTENQKLDVYRKINIPVVETSTKDMTGIDTLKKYLKNIQAIFVGNSGVGKSSLINAIMQDDQIKTSHVSNKSKRGRHTTTSSKYYVWSENSSIIDTPGIRSLDVSNFSPLEIQDYFPEFDVWKNRCKYKNCLHYNEPEEYCFVKQGVTVGAISKSRYESYLRIMRNVMGKI